MIQFLQTLADGQLLTFDHDAPQWWWDPDRIHAEGYTDNVVDLMVGKLVRLPGETQQALQQLACLGNVAGIEALSTVLGIPGAQVRGVLWEAIRLELVERLDDAYGFVHDRIHEAAYSLIPPRIRAPRRTCESDDCSPRRHPRKGRKRRSSRSSASSIAAPY
nr:hypothetical protein GCM10020185_80000 [Pseudomonas brassicacearum subsp. brassicacearum]